MGATAPPCRARTGPLTGSTTRRRASPPRSRARRLRRRRRRRASGASGGGASQKSRRSGALSQQPPARACCTSRPAIARAARPARGGAASRASRLREIGTCARVSPPCRATAPPMATRTPRCPATSRRGRATRHARRAQRRTHTSATAACAGHPAHWRWSTEREPPTLEPSADARLMILSTCKLCILIESDRSLAREGRLDAEPHLLLVNFPNLSGLLLQRDAGQQTLEEVFG